MCTKFPRPIVENVKISKPLHPTYNNNIQGFQQTFNLIVLNVYFSSVFSIHIV